MRLLFRWQLILPRPSSPKAIAPRMPAISRAAASELETGLAQHPEDDAARAALSRVRGAIAVRSAIEHHRAGRWSEAEARYQAVLEQDPENVDALHFRGFLAYEQGLPERAAELISRSLELEPSNVHAQFNLGRVRQTQGRDAERSEEHTSELQSQSNLVCGHLLEKKKWHGNSRQASTDALVQRAQVDQAGGAAI